MALRVKMYGTPTMVCRWRRFLKLKAMFFFLVMLAFAAASTNFVNVMYWRKIEVFDKYFGAREHVGRTSAPPSSIKETNVGK